MRQRTYRPVRLCRRQRQACNMRASTQVITAYGQSHPTHCASP